MAQADADLVERVRAGEPAAYEGLVLRHYDRAIAVARGVLGNDPAVDDVAQEAFLKAYRKLASLQEPEYYPAWLLRIVRNEASNWLRRHRGRRTYVPLPEQMAADEPGASRQDEEADARDAEIERFQTALGALRNNYREILNLKYEAGLSYEELAESLHISISNVEKRLYRARQALQKQMDKLK